MVLSYAYWMTRFAGDPTIVGKSVLVYGRNMTVIGVAQRGFDAVELGNIAKIFIRDMMMREIYTRIG